MSARDWRNLYDRVHDLLVPLSAHGTINNRDDRVRAVHDALHAIDGGTYSPDEISPPRSTIKTDSAPTKHAAMAQSDHAATALGLAALPGLKNGSEHIACPACRRVGPHDPIGCDWWTCGGCGCQWNEDARHDGCPNDPDPCSACGQDYGAHFAPDGGGCAGYRKGRP